MAPHNPWNSGDPRYPLRLIPKSGSQPDIRDQLGQEDQEQWEDLDRQICALTQEIEQAKAGGMEDVEVKARLELLNEQRNALVIRYQNAVRQWGRDIIVALASALPPKLKERELKKLSRDPLFRPYPDDSKPR